MESTLIVVILTIARIGIPLALLLAVGEAMKKSQRARPVA
jgi:hypothetical protein